MFIGTAGWSIPGAVSARFNAEGSHLHRYSQVLNLAEINSSFYREHLPRTYQKWASEVPVDFKFSVKLSKKFTHERELNPRIKDLKESFDSIFHLEKKLAVVLIQLPPKLEFDSGKTDRFLKNIRKIYHGHLVIEPRNDQWASLQARKVLEEYQVSKVIADPERCHGTKKMTQIGGISYFRLHGTPVIYRSSYTRNFLKQLAKDILTRKNCFCVFDNTTLGLGTENALELKSLLH